MARVVIAGFLKLRANMRVAWAQTGRADIVRHHKALDVRKMRAVPSKECIRALARDMVARFFLRIRPRDVATIRVVANASMQCESSCVFLLWSEHRPSAAPFPEV